MDDIDRLICMSAIRVRWLEHEGVYVASSEQLPGLGYRHESALTAFDGLVGLIYDSLAHDRDRKGPGHHD